MAFPTLGSRSQTDMLLEHFLVRQDISALEAQSLFRIRSLSRRINDLEARGHLFNRVMKTDTTGQRYVRYFYKGMDLAVVQGEEARW